MRKNSFKDLCKKVKAAWPQPGDKELGGKSLFRQVAFLRSFSNLKRFFSPCKEPISLTPAIQCIDEKQAKGEVANVCRCSLDARHYHLMIHGEALARRHMGKKRFYVCKHREKEIAIMHLKRIHWLQACLRKRNIMQVRLDDTHAPYDLMHPNIVVEKNCSLTRITPFNKH